MLRNLLVALTVGVIGLAGATLFSEHDIQVLLHDKLHAKDKNPTDSNEAVIKAAMAKADLSNKASRPTSLGATQTATLKVSKAAAHVCMPVCMY